jgi:uncharacterized protein YndB with AHSA1/START domain
MKRLGLVLLVMSACCLARADVRDVQPTLFTIESSATSTAAPADVYTALTNPARWWHPRHTWSGDAKNLSMDATAGGCYCEKLAGGGSVQHSRVVWAEPGRRLKLDGAFGPLQDMAVDALMTFTLEPAGTGTKITLSFRASGNFTLEAAKLAPVVDQVLGQQLARLREFADTGRAPAAGSQ